MNSGFRAMTRDWSGLTTTGVMAALKWVVAPLACVLWEQFGQWMLSDWEEK